MLAEIFSLEYHNVEFKNHLHFRVFEEWIVTHSDAAHSGFGLQLPNDY